MGPTEFGAGLPHTDNIGTWFADDAQSLGQDLGFIQPESDNEAPPEGGEEFETDLDRRQAAEVGRLLVVLRIKLTRPLSSPNSTLEDLLNALLPTRLKGYLNRHTNSH